MLKAIVAHNDPYEQLSDSERDEFNTWIDECKSQVADPEPSDVIPFDNELDNTVALKDAGWEKQHLCDCGEFHTSAFHLNAATGNYQCPDCIEAQYKAERKRDQLEREHLQHEIEYLSNPENMFREYLKTKGAA